MGMALLKPALVARSKEKPVRCYTFTRNCMDQPGSAASKADRSDEQPLHFVHHHAHQKHVSANAKTPCIKISRLK